MTAERDLNAMPAAEYKVLENKLRRMLDRQGFTLVKSRRRDPRAVDFGGYMIVNAGTNYVEAGGEGNGYTLDLNDVERFATEGTPA